MVSHWFTRHAWRGTLLSGLVILLTWGCKATDMLPEMRLTSPCESVEFNWDGTDTDRAWVSYIDVDVHCSDPYQYTSSCDASWVHVADFPELQRITIRADINTQTSQRSAIIRVETSNLRGETTQLQIQVVQQGTSEILSQDRLDLAADRTDTHSITIFASRFESKIGITAPGWIKCSTSYNTDNMYALRVKSYPNLTTNPREGEIVLTVLSQTESDTLYTTRIRVTQPGAAHSFIEQDQVVLNDAGDEITIPVYYTGQWECSSSVSWLKVEQRQGTTENQSVMAISASPSLLSEPRDGIIVVETEYIDGWQFRDTVYVTQQKATHPLIEQDQVVLNDAGDEITIPVYYTGQWECSSSVSWLKVEQRQGTTENQSVMAISASPSFLSEPRNGIIVVETERIDGWQFRDTVYVTQQGLPDDIYDQITNPRLRDAIAEQCGTPHQILRSKLKTLTTLDLTAASGENITSLDDILRNCSALEQLICSNLGLTTLDLTPLSSLQSLDCSHNQLTSIESLPYSLQSLDCSYNNFTTLSSFTERTILRLNCSHNQLQGDFTYIYNINGLTYLDCSYNSITTMYNTTSQLQTLICSHNTLTTLSPPRKLQLLDCSYNKLRSLDFSYNTSLQRLICTQNPYLQSIQLNSTIRPTLDYTIDSTTRVY